MRWLHSNVVINSVTGYNNVKWLSVYLSKRVNCGSLYFTIKHVVSNTCIDVVNEKQEECNDMER